MKNCYDVNSSIFLYTIENCCVIIRLRKVIKMVNLKIFNLSANEELTNEVCKYLLLPKSQCSVKHFADGETKLEPYYIILVLLALALVCLLKTFQRRFLRIYPAFIVIAIVRAVLMCSSVPSFI